MSDKPLTPVPYSKYPDPTRSGLSYAGDQTGWYLYQQAHKGDWTPTLTATTTSPTMGTGAIQIGDYVYWAGRVWCRFKIAFGSAGMAAGSGTYEMGGLPFPPDVATIDGSIPVGQVHLRDVGLASKYWTAVLTIGGVIRFNDDNGVEVTNAAPWAWGANDNMRGEFWYRVEGE